ncbi:MAG: hypothetical protein NXH85_10180 [Pseudomonadaceae bacterium]|nr:hypothetical protein [Pseudomonadaceae bacterium]
MRKTCFDSLLPLLRLLLLPILGLQMVACETPTRSELWFDAMGHSPPLPLRVSMDPVLPEDYQAAVQLITEQLGFTPATEPLAAGAAELELIFQINQSSDLFAQVGSPCHLGVGEPDPNQPGQYRRCGTRLPVLRWWVMLYGNFNDGTFDDEGALVPLLFSNHWEFRRSFSPYEGEPLEYGESDLANACKALVGYFRYGRDSLGVVDVIRGRNALASRVCYKGVFGDPSRSDDKSGVSYQRRFNIARALMLVNFGADDPAIVFDLLKYQNPQDPIITPIVQHLTNHSRAEVRELAREMLATGEPGIKCPWPSKTSRCTYLFK